MRITVRLVKPVKNKIITYHGMLIQHTPTYRLLVARWEMERVDLGYVVFEPGDILHEHYYTNRWYNVYALHTSAGSLKGWYCNITRPAIFNADSIESEDLELDLFVAPDRRTLLVLDEDEYAARGLALSDPDAHQEVQAAMVELHRLAEQGAAPFDSAETTDEHG